MTIEIEDSDWPEGYQHDFGFPPKEVAEHLGERCRGKAVAVFRSMVNTNGAPDLISIEEHGGGEALYVGRWPWQHGFNIVHLTDPAFQWPKHKENPGMRELVVAAVNAAPLLLERHDKMVELLARAATILDASDRAQERVTADIEAFLLSLTK